MENNFSIFVPIDTIEKGTDKNGKAVMKIGGVISNSLVGPDLDGETIDVEGMDFSKFLSKGFINYHHLASKDPSAIIGEPIKAYVKEGKAHFEGILYPESEMAQKVYDLANVLSKSSSTRKLGYSIEGTATHRDEKNPKRIRKSSVSGLAVTPFPKNGGTEVMVLKGEVEYETQPGSTFLIDITENGVRYTVDKNLEIVKAMVAGAVTGTETTNQALTGEPLKPESVEGGQGKKKKKAKIKNLISKGEVFTMLIKDHNLDATSCKRVWHLASEIQKNLSV